jgi:hypothetical protein
LWWRKQIQLNKYIEVAANFIKTSKVPNIWEKFPAEERLYHHHLHYTLLFRGGVDDDLILRCFYFQHWKVLLLEECRGESATVQSSHISPIFSCHHPSPLLEALSEERYRLALNHGDCQLGF